MGATMRSAGRIAHRKTAITVGSLFIIGDIAGVLSFMVTGGLLNGSDALSKIAASQGHLVLGALLVLVMGALESVTYMASAGAWLLLVELSREHAAAADPGAPFVHSLGALLSGSTAAWLTSIVFSLGSLMFYYLFYQSRLVPRWLSVWGLVGAVLYLATPLLAMFGHGFGLLMAPLAVAEIVLAVWLIVRGLNSPAPPVTPA